MIRLQILRHCVRQSSGNQDIILYCALPYCVVLCHAVLCCTGNSMLSRLHAALLAHMMHGSVVRDWTLLLVTSGPSNAARLRLPASQRSSTAVPVAVCQSSARPPRSGAGCRSSVRPATARHPGAEPCCTHPSSERCRSVAHAM